MNNTKNNEDNSDKLLRFLDEFLKQPNTDSFRKQLLEILIKHSNPTYQSNRQIDAFDYLSIKTDTDALKLVDYRGITHDQTRRILVADGQQMWRYRLGTINNKIEFLEYCRFAQLQIELMINYYLWRKSKNNLDKALEYITKYNPTQQFVYKPGSISSIGFAIKWYTIRAAFNLSNRAEFVISKLNDVRNVLSHRKVGMDKTNKEYYNSFVAEQDFDGVFRTLDEFKNEIIQHINKKEDGSRIKLKGPKVVGKIDLSKFEKK